MNLVTNTKTMRYLYLFYYILIIWCLGGTEVAAGKEECADSCDESVDCDGDDYEDSASQSDDSGADTDHLLSRIDELENELLGMLQTKANLTSALIDCLRKLKIQMSKSSKSKRRGLDLSHLTSGDSDSDYYEDDSTAERYNGKCTGRLNDKIRDLERSKNTLKREIERLQTHIVECDVKLPKPKIKKYIIHTTKVSWSEAVRLCTNEQKQIASITSQNEQDALVQARKDQDVPRSKIWIGSRYDSKGGGFSWIGQNLTAFTYTNWHCDEPGNYYGEELCVASNLHYYIGMWFLYECSTEYDYACEYY